MSNIKKNININSQCVKTTATANESHRSHHMNWLRAAVLGANDGIVSTASLMVGVAAASSSRENILLAGAAGLVAGAMSMAAGEYVSVSSQSDTEKADLRREANELELNPELELEELTHIYIARGLDSLLARQVAEQLTSYDAIGSHARDELGITDNLKARPVQAALSSATAFAIGASMPLIIVIFLSAHFLVVKILVSSLFCLVGLGVVTAKIGGANIWKSSIRILFWGALAMLMTAGLGALLKTKIN